jgi:hypothetical protein
MQFDNFIREWDHPRRGRLLVSVMPLAGPGGHEQAVPVEFV